MFLITKYFYKKSHNVNHLVGGLVTRIWNQEVYSSCNLRFKSCDY